MDVGILLISFSSNYWRPRKYPIIHTKPWTVRQALNLIKSISDNAAVLHLSRSAFSGFHSSNTEPHFCGFRISPPPYLIHTLNRWRFPVLSWFGNRMKSHFLNLHRQLTFQLSPQHCGKAPAGNEAKLIQLIRHSLITNMVVLFPLKA